MAGAINQGDEAYSHFNAGFDSRQAPLSAIDKKILNFAVRLHDQPALKAHGQILRNFGMYPPEFWNRAQRLSGHPELSQRENTKLAYIFPDPARPGPMGGGAPVENDGNKFSHGTEW